VLGDLWKGLGGKLADRWLAALFSPAFAFWLGGFATWLYAYGASAVAREGWVGALKRWTAGVQGLPVVAQGLLVVGPLLLVTLFGLLLQQMSWPVLRLMEGYWPRPLDPPRERLRARLSSRTDRLLPRLRELSARPAAQLSAGELAERGRLARRYQSVPPVPAQRMPTRLGNVLRAAELRSSSRYGLDAVTCWPRLWLLLPEAVRQEVVTARSALYLAIQVWILGVVFPIWSFWAWWAAPLGLFIAVLTYYGRILPAARIYGDLILSCYDVHRGLIYSALRWPLPAHPAEEIRFGKRISAYLTAGSREESPAFTTTEHSSTT